MCLDCSCLFFFYQLLYLIHTKPLPVHAQAIFVKLLIGNSRYTWIPKKNSRYTWSIEF